MSAVIRCVYEREPAFPATDQHPEAVRYEVAGYFVDAIGGMPTQEAIEAVLNPPSPKSAQEILDALLDNGVVTQEEIDAAAGAAP